MVLTEREAGSFRDPAGEVLVRDGVCLRRVSPDFISEYRGFMSSGLYSELVSRGLLLSHTEEADELGLVLRPEQVGFISYPYEWCFSMLKEAALNTLEINRLALEHGMILKDASAFNMQYHNGKMTLIDTLSFARYKEGQPWWAYRQFIQHFLVPLLLMKYQDASLAKLSEVFIDGIPVNLATQLLPLRTRLRPSLLAHLYAQGIKLNGGKLPKEVNMPRRNLDALLDNLRGVAEGLKYKAKSAWSAYDSCSYTQKAFKSKCGIVEVMLGNVPVSSDNTLCDIGANTGAFTEIAVKKGYKIVAVDSDHDCVEYQYSGWYQYIQGGLTRNSRLPLVVDICNPTPAIGWGNTERKSFLDRLNVDTIMALALIHHLCIGNNIPLGMVSDLLSGHCKNLIIEYVPLNDPKVQLIAQNKTFPPYSQDIFERELGRHFDTVKRARVEDSVRSIYLMARR